MMPIILELKQANYFFKKSKITKNCTFQFSFPLFPHFFELVQFKVSSRDFSRYYVTLVKFAFISLKISISNEANLLNRILELDIYAEAIVDQELNKLMCRKYVPQIKMLKNKRHKEPYANVSLIEF